MEVAEKCQILQNQVFCVGDVEHILQGLELRPPSRLHFVALGEPWNCRLWRWKIFLYTVNYSSSILLLICALMIASTKKVPKTTLGTFKFIILYFLVENNSWKFQCVKQRNAVSNVFPVFFIPKELENTAHKDYMWETLEYLYDKANSIWLLELPPFPTYLWFVE